MEEFHIGNKINATQSIVSNVCIYICLATMQYTINTGSTLNCLMYHGMYLYTLYNIIAFTKKHINFFVCVLYRTVSS